MQTPNIQWAAVTNRSIQSAVDALPFAQREYFEERAGLLQHDAGMERAAAEGLALQQTKDLFQIA